MKNKIIILIYIMSGWAIMSCNKLDVKPRQSLVVPTTLQDFQGILDNTDVMNSPFCSLSEISADNYYITPTTYNSLTLLQDQRAYTWEKDIFKGVTADGDWQYSYQRVFYANVALDGLNKVAVTPANQSNFNNIKGQALFHRAYNFYMISQEFAPVYKSASASADLGIVLRLTSDLNVKSVRSTIQQTYDQMISDLSSAKDLLPVTPLYKTRPSKVAAYAMLARVYLAKQDYSNALANADSCLKLYDKLIDYNTLSATATVPFALFNDEVIFHGTTSATILRNNKAIVDSNLYRSYAPNDLRQKVFFGANADNTHFFKGNYSGSTSLFEGIATDEIYLIRAECNARLGNTNAAMNDYNLLLAKRYVSGSYTPVSAANADNALSMILTERRKELLFRFARWTDLRRLNLDTRFAIPLTRMLNGTTYTLPPNDPRYTLSIPDYIIAQNGIQQNPQ